MTLRLRNEARFPDDYNIQISTGDKCLYTVFGSRFMTYSFNKIGGLSSNFLFMVFLKREYVDTLIVTQNTRV